MMHENPIAQTDSERRKDKRRPVLTYIQLSSAHHVLAMARTIDFSSTGIAGTSDATLRVYQEIGVGINGLGTVYGTVVRKVGSNFAVQFKTPIDIEKFDISQIVQSHIALPDWLPRHSEGCRYFAQLDVPKPFHREPAKIDSESFHEEEPCGGWGKSEVEQCTPPEPVRIVHENIYEEKLRDPRSATSARIAIRKLGFNKCKADILDISQTGLQLDCSLHFNHGERLLVDLPGLGALSATTVWHNDFRTGCKFENPISEYVYIDLVGRLSV
jgi:PilZ domain